MNAQTIENLDVYVVDIRSTVIPYASNQSISQSAWMLNANVLLPVEELVEFVLEDHLSAAKRFQRDIQVAYVQGLWPNHLSADKIRLTPLAGLDKLAQKMPTTAIAAAHQAFLNAAADFAALAQEGNIEAASDLLWGDFAGASQQLVALLQAGMPRLAKPSARSLPALPA